MYAIRSYYGHTVNEWYGTTLLSRLDDKETGAIILVMQRLHEDDLAGKLVITSYSIHYTKLYDLA